MSLASAAGWESLLRSALVGRHHGAGVPEKARRAGWLIDGRATAASVGRERSREDIVEVCKTCGCD